MCISPNTTTTGLATFSSGDVEEEYSYDNPAIVWTCGYVVIPDITYQILLMAGCLIGPLGLTVIYLVKKGKYSGEREVLD